VYWQPRGLRGLRVSVTINAKLIVDGASSSGGAHGADRFGWVAQISSVAAGAFQSRGTWAVTAP